MRTFDTGATRDNNNGKLEYSNFIHPLADYSFAEYMKSKQIIWGEYRRWDNWQKGIPEESLYESLIRHIETLKLLKKWYKVVELSYENNTNWIVTEGNIEWEKYTPWAKIDVKDIETELNAIRFNSEAMKLYYLDNW